MKRTPRKRKRQVTLFDLQKIIRQRRRELADAPQGRGGEESIADILKVVVARILSRQRPEAA